ncbi:MAG: glycosyltransferase [Candidatus Nanoarchaeia archaeon]
MKKVLVGCTIADIKAYCLQEYLEGLKKLDYKRFDILLADNSKTDDFCKQINELGITCVKTEHTESIAQNIVIGMNYLRDYVLKNDYDYLFCLQSDVIPPANIIQLLLEANKDIVTGVASHLLVKDGEAKEIALLGIEDKEHPGNYTYLNYKSTKQYKGLLSVDFCAMTCILLSRKALEQITFRYETKDGQVIPEDMCFCKDAKKLGFEITAQLEAQCQHLFYGGYSVTLGDTTGISKVKKE